MPNVIDNTYFKYDLAIPQAIGQPSIISDTPNNVDAVTDCITEVEKSLLRNALGLLIYNQLQNALGNLEAADQKWKDLVNGVEYNGKSWEGLKSPKSLIAYYVYYTFLDENSTFWTTLGIEKPAAENSKNAVPDFKLATAYQKFLKKYQAEACDEPYRSFYGGVLLTDWYGNNDNVEVSLFHFLRDNKAAYGWETENFKFYPQLNSFGI